MATELETMLANRFAQRMVDLGGLPLERHADLRDSFTIIAEPNGFR